MIRAVLPNNFPVHPIEKGTDGACTPFHNRVNSRKKLDPLTGYTLHTSSFGKNPPKGLLKNLDKFSQYKSNEQLIKEGVRSGYEILHGLGVTSFAGIRVAHSGIAKRSASRTSSKVPNWSVKQKFDVEIKKPVGARRKLMTFELINRCLKETCEVLPKTSNKDSWTNLLDLRLHFEEFCKANDYRIPSISTFSDSIGHCYAGVIKASANDSKRKVVNVAIRKPFNSPVASLVANFVREELVISQPDAKGARRRTPKEIVYDAYKKYCGGRNTVPLDYSLFNKELLLEGVERSSNWQGYYVQLRSVLEHLAKELDRLSKEAGDRLSSESAIRRRVAAEKAEAFGKLVHQFIDERCEILPVDIRAQQNWTPLRVFMDAVAEFLNARGYKIVANTLTSKLYTALNGRLVTATSINKTSLHGSTKYINAMVLPEGTEKRSEKVAVDRIASDVSSLRSLSSLQLTGNQKPHTLADVVKKHREREAAEGKPKAKLVQNSLDSFVDNMALSRRRSDVCFIVLQLIAELSNNIEAVAMLMNHINAANFAFSSFQNLSAFGHIEFTIPSDPLVDADALDKIIGLSVEDDETLQIKIECFLAGNTALAGKVSLVKMQDPYSWELQAQPFAIQAQMHDDPKVVKLFAELAKLMH